MSSKKASQLGVVSVSSGVEHLEESVIISMIRSRRSLKIFIFLIFIVFIFQLFLKFRNGDKSSTNGTSGSDLKDWNTNVNYEERAGAPGFIKNAPDIIDKNILSPAEIKDISQKIKDINSQQVILNEDKFGSQIGRDSFVLVVQVHTRVEYLELLIESLAKVQHIESSLVIFSHDVFVPELNEAISKIDFCRVVQIFYPHSIQLHPNSFPGQSPSDCQRDMSPKQARLINCTNAAYPDNYGHYREARYTQTKHHWWWKANFVFNSIRALTNYTGVVIFLEEDHYVAPDFLWFLNLIETIMTRNLCKGCNVISLGTYLKTWNIRTSSDTAVVTNWVSSFHNMGMGFNRTMWKNIEKCSKLFCEYDDYNWDWSLLQMSYNCLKSPLSVIYPKSPRIFHIGDCGVHHKKKVCNPQSAVKVIEKKVKDYESLLFPDLAKIEFLKAKKLRLKKGNGGFSDIRDHKLCLSF